MASDMPEVVQCEVLRNPFLAKENFAGLILGKGNLGSREYRKRNEFLEFPRVRHLRTCDFEQALPSRT